MCNSKLVCTFRHVILTIPCPTARAYYYTNIWLNVCFSFIFVFLTINHHGTCSANMSTSGRYRLETQISAEVCRYRTNTRPIYVLCINVFFLFAKYMFNHSCMSIQFDGLRYKQIYICMDISAHCRPDITFTTW